MDNDKRQRVVNQVIKMYDKVVSDLEAADELLTSGYLDDHSLTPGERTKANRLYLSFKDNSQKTLKKMALLLRQLD